MSFFSFFTLLHPFSTETLNITVVSILNLRVFCTTWCQCWQRVLPSRDLCCLFNVPLLWWLHGSAVQLNIRSLPFHTVALFVPNAQGRGVRPPVYDSCVCFWDGSGLGSSDYFALRLSTISCTNSVVSPRECYVQCLYELKKLRCPWTLQSTRSLEGVLTL